MGQLYKSDNSVREIELQLCAIRAHKSTQFVRGNTCADPFEFVRGNTCTDPDSFLAPPVDGANLRAAAVASAILGALPPVDLRAVCFVLCGHKI